MKKQLLFLLITILNINCYSQISFEKGYFINNSDEKIDCLIKNIDWKNNPTEFEYKLSEVSESKKAISESIKEFGIDNISKYIRQKVGIDRSSENIGSISSDKNPKFKEEELFLKVLVEGKANLYYYEDENLKRYFYNIDNSNTEQLIYKSYIISNNQKGENNGYRQQLWNDLKCQDITIKNIENLDYTKKALMNFFSEYNNCTNSEITYFEKKQKNELFNINFRAGINYSSLTINNIRNTINVDFDNELGFRFGLEAEFIMPFNKNKWALLVEPTYQYYKSEKETILYPNSVFEETVFNKVNYKSIELAIGIRHYFFLNNNSSIFINGSSLFDFSGNSTIDIVSARFLEIKTETNFAFGLGYKNIDKYSLELRYQTSRQITIYEGWNSNYNTLSAIFGYTIF